MRNLVAGAFGLALIAFAGPISADEVGQSEFMNFCSGCHGADGTGDGPVVATMQIETPDLTTITERTGGGDFPFWNTLKLIDGREVRAHGGEMPLWGERFQMSATSRRGETAEMVARGRILSLVTYLQSIQQ